MRRISSSGRHPPSRMPETSAELWGQLVSKVVALDLRERRLQWLQGPAQLQPLPDPLGLATGLEAALVAERNSKSVRQVTPILAEAIRERQLCIDQSLLRVAVLDARLDAVRRERIRGAAWVASANPGFDLGEQPVESGGMRGEQPGGLDLPRRIQIIIAELVEEVLHLRELLQRRIAGILEGERPADVTLVRRMHALELLESRSDRRNGGPIRERLDPPEVRHSTRPRWDPRIRPA